MQDRIEDLHLNLLTDIPDHPVANAEIDITADLCPMTFVRTRLALDRMRAGEILLVRLRGAEPLENVPRTATALGHAVLSIETDAGGITLVRIRRG